MPPTSVTVKVVGLSEMAAAAAEFSAFAWERLRAHLLEAGYAVRVDVEGLYLEVNKNPDEKGAGGIRNEASYAGAFVVQSIRKTSNTNLRRPNYGPRMMVKAFLPAAWANRSKTLLAAVAAVEEARATFWDRQTVVG